MTLGTSSAAPPPLSPVHFGVLCPDLQGHLNPMLTLCRELQARGHRITCYLPGGHRNTGVDASGIRFRTFGEQEFSADSRAADMRQLAELSGLKALRFTVEIIRRRTAACLREVPAMLREDGADAVIGDQVLYEGATVAQEVGLPHVTVCNALALHAGPGIPPFFLPWRYSRSWPARLRNALAEQLSRRIVSPVVRTINARRVAIGLPAHRAGSETYSTLAQVSQQPAEFDFPRQALPDCFHYAGPFHASGARKPQAFPWEKLDGGPNGTANGRPLVYASMGTLQNRLGEVFGAIAEACAGLPVQLVIALGGEAAGDAFDSLPGSPIVVPYAPQLELLRRARLCITHAGLNTALESLAQGVPMVAIPITNDQPGVASRIDWTGTGLCIPLKRLTAARLRRAVERVLREPGYAENAKRLQQAIARSGGVRGAADVIERAVAATRPVEGFVQHPVRIE